MGFLARRTRVCSRYTRGKPRVSARELWGRTRPGDRIPGLLGYDPFHYVVYTRPSLPQMTASRFLA